MRTGKRPGLAVLLLALSLAIALPAPARGAGLTGGTYTYLLNGEEIAFPFDPVLVNEELLLPASVFERLGISVAEAAGRVTLRLTDGVEIKLTLGSPSYTLDGRPLEAPAVPIRLGGHLFLPAALLKHFGVELTRTGSLLMLRQPLTGALPTTAFSNEEFQQLKSRRSFRREISHRQQSIVDAEFTLLDGLLLEAPQLGLGYGHRVKLRSLLENHTLVLVRLSNRWSDPATFVPGSVVLVDDLRHQADLVQTLDVGEGDLSAPLAPGADRRAVLAFPGADPAATRLLLYYHEIGESLGAFHLNQ